MKIIALFTLLICSIAACSQPKEKVIVKGELCTYALVDSTIYLATKDTTEFNVKLYEGKDGLMMESPRALSGCLFGVKSKTGFRDRIKYDFDFLGTQGASYVYGISYHELPSFWGVYYLENLDYCWVFYQYDDYSNKPDMAQFSAKEFEMYFKNTRAHIMN